MVVEENIADLLSISEQMDVQVMVTWVLRRGNIDTKMIGGFKRRCEDSSVFVVSISNVDRHLIKDYGSLDVSKWFYEHI